MFCDQVVPLNDWGVYVDVRIRDLLPFYQIVVALKLVDGLNHLDYAHWFICADHAWSLCTLGVDCENFRGDFLFNFLVVICVKKLWKCFFCYFSLLGSFGFFWFFVDSGLNSRNFLLSIGYVLDLPYLWLEVFHQQRVLIRHFLNDLGRWH